MVNNFNSRKSIFVILLIFILLFSITSISVVSAGTHNLSSGNSIKSTIEGDSGNIDITLSNGTYSHASDYNINICSSKNVTIKR